MSGDGVTNRRILIIDDNESIHQDYNKVLVGPAANTEFDALSAEIFGDEFVAEPSHAVYELESAFQGKEGLARVMDSIDNGRPFAMAFVDMRMPPGWDGLQTIEEIWKVDPKLCVVICSAYSDHSWADVAKRLGTNDRWLVLKKPFDSAEVRQLAAALVEKKRMADILKEGLTALEV